MKGKMIKDGSINIATKLDKDNFTTDTSDNKSLVNVESAKQIVSSEFTNSIEPNHTTDMGNPRSFVDVETLQANAVTVNKHGRKSVDVALQNGTFTAEGSFVVDNSFDFSKRLLSSYQIAEDVINMSYTINTVNYAYFFMVGSSLYFKYKITVDNPNNNSGSFAITVDYIQFNLF